MSICHLAVMFSVWCNTHKSRTVFKRFWLNENKHGSGAVIQITHRVLVSSKRGGGRGQDPIPVITRGLNFVLRVPRRWARICCSHNLLLGLWLIQPSLLHGISTFGKVRQSHQVGLDFYRTTSGQWFATYNL